MYRHPGQGRTGQSFGVPTGVILATPIAVSGCRTCYPRIHLTESLGLNTWQAPCSRRAVVWQRVVSRSSAMAAPRTLWRIRLQDGSVVHCVLWERKPKTAVVWYRDDEVQGVVEFEDPAEA